MGKHKECFVVCLHFFMTLFLNYIFLINFLVIFLFLFSYKKNHKKEKLRRKNKCYEEDNNFFEKNSLIWLWNILQIHSNLSSNNLEIPFSWEFFITIQWCWLFQMFFKTSKFFFQHSKRSNVFLFKANGDIFYHNFILLFKVVNVCRLCPFLRLIFGQNEPSGNVAACIRTNSIKMQNRSFQSLLGLFSAKYAKKLQFWKNTRNTFSSSCFQCVFLLFFIFKTTLGKFFFG